MNSASICTAQLPCTDVGPRVASNVLDGTSRFAIAIKWGTERHASARASARQGLWSYITVDTDKHMRF